MPQKTTAGPCWHAFDWILKVNLIAFHYPIFSKPNETYSRTFQGLSRTTLIFKYFQGLEYATLKFEHFQELLKTRRHHGNTHPWTTVRRNLHVRSTTSSQTLETPWKSVASGRDWSACNDSRRTWVQRSASSPDRHARCRNANAKLSAAREPTNASPDSGW